jgi:hypothetical protein
MNNKVTNHPEHYFLNRMTRTSTARTALGEFSMYTPKHIAEAMAELFDDPKWEGGMGARQPLLGAICGIESRGRRAFRKKR